MDSYTIENLIRKYVELRKEVAKEYNYSVYPDYVGGIRKLSCNPINILINILKCTILGPIKIFLKNLRRKTNPESYDFEFTRDTFRAINRIYELMYSETGLKIDNIVLRHKDLIKAKHILEDVISKMRDYSSYLTFAMGFCGDL